MLTEIQKDKIIDKHWLTILAQAGGCDESGCIDFDIEENGIIYFYKIYVSVEETQWMEFNLHFSHFLTTD